MYLKNWPHGCDLSLTLPVGGRLGHQRADELEGAAHRDDTQDQRGVCQKNGINKPRNVGWRGVHRG